MKECSTNSWAEITIIWLWTWGFPGSSAGKESTCNAGDCRSRRFNPWVWKIPWRRDRLPTPYSWAALVAQLVKNPPAMWETWVWSLGWKDPLEKGKASHSRVLAWRIPRIEESGGLSTMGSQRIRHKWATNPFTWLPWVAQVVKTLPATQGIHLCSIPGSGRSPGEGNGYPLQYSCLEMPWTEQPGRLHSPWGHKELDVTEQLTFTFFFRCILTLTMKY